MSHIAIILARGGSKRLPRKNMLDFFGKPMLAWTVEAALHSGQFDRVLVSTDDREIAEIGRSFGAEAPFLRETAVDDLATSSEATLAALKQAEEYWGEQYDVVSQLMANCPLRDAKDIKATVQNFMDQGAESQISCFRFGWMNPWWAAKINQQNVPEYLFPKARSSRSQDLPPLYCLSGAIWVSRTAVLRSEKTFYARNHVLYPLSLISAVDIDDESDMEMAKLYFLNNRQREK